MATICDSIVPKTVLDEIVEKSVFILKIVFPKNELNTSGIVFRQILRKTVRKDIYHRVSSPEGLGFIELIDDLIAVDPLDVRVLNGAGFWMQKLPPSPELFDYWAELLASCTLLIESVVTTELRGY